LFEYKDETITLTGTKEIVIPQFLKEFDWNGEEIHLAIQKEIKSWESKLHWEL
jgi:hypothetical protein